MTRRCQYPGCSNHAAATWATVPVCLIHREMLEKEALKYYAKRITAAERIAYKQIKKLTPWG